MTLRYAHLAPETLRDTIELLDPKVPAVSNVERWATGGQRDIVSLEKLFQNFHA